MLTNAFRHLTRLPATAQRRSMSTSVSSKTWLGFTEKPFRAGWTKDPGTYPIMVILTFAVSFVVGVSASCLAFNPDVQISPKKRASILREHS